PLALDPVTCPALPVDAFDADCVRGGDTGPYRQGTGTVVVISGTFGRTPNPLNPADPEAPDFAVLNGTSNGLVFYRVSVDRLEANFVSGSGTVLDHFLLGAEAPGLTVDAGPADGATVTDPSPVYGGAALDPGGSVAGVVVAVDGGPFSATGVSCPGCAGAAASWTWTPPAPLAAGAHVIAFRA